VVGRGREIAAQVKASTVRLSAAGFEPNCRESCRQVSFARLGQPEQPVRQPQVEIEPERAALHRLQHGHIERDRARDDLVEELLAELDPLG